MISRQNIIAYCALSMGMTMLNRAFNFYYVKVFLNHYNIEETWFHTAQVLYMVWNAINDPVFAILQDNTSFLLTRTRREGILYTAPFTAFAFLVPWFQFGKSSWAVGMHLIISLFLWDTMYTFNGLLCCCLFTEFSTDTHTRLMLTRYSTITSLIGAQGVFFLELASNSLQNFQAFQMVAVFLAFVACLLLVYTGRNAHTQYDKSGDCCDKLSDKEEKDTEEGTGFLRKTLQLFTERNFVSFVTTNFFQVLHDAFLGGFTAIVCEYLVPTDQVPPGVRSFFYTMTGTCGGIVVILITPIVGHLGYFRVIRYSFLWKMASGIAMYLFIGSSNAWIIMVFLLLDTSFNSAMFCLFNMPLSDIADHDKEKYKRKKPISSTVFGTNALVTKPAQSVSPMLVVAILNHFGYEQVKNGLGSDLQKEEVKSVMFQLICFFPMILGFIQYLFWSGYTFRNRIIQKDACCQDLKS